MDYILAQCSTQVETTLRDSKRSVFIFYNYILVLLCDMYFITVCSDNNDKCELWAVEGECGINPKFMLRHCQKACKVCSATTKPTPKSTELIPAKGKSHSFNSKLRQKTNGYNSAIITT